MVVGGGVVAGGYVVGGFAGAVTNVTNGVKEVKAATLKKKDAKAKQRQLESPMTEKKRMKMEPHTHPAVA
jgi:hypothetical protein